MNVLCYGQDRHPDRGRGHAAGGAGRGRAARASRCSASPTSTPPSRRASQPDRRGDPRPPARSTSRPGTEARRGALRLPAQAPERSWSPARGATVDGHQGRAGERARGLHHGGGRPTARRVPLATRPRADRRAVRRAAARGLPHAGGRARKKLRRRARIDKDDESGMTFLGFLVFCRPAEGRASRRTIRRLRGARHRAQDDHRRQRAGRRARRRAARPGTPAVLTGPELRRMSDEALLQPGRQRRPLRRDRAEPEGADHPGAAEGGARRRLHGRRHQRRLGAARRRRRHLGRQRGRRGQGGRRHRAAREGPGRAGRRASGRAAPPSPTP